MAIVWALFPWYIDHLLFYNMYNGDTCVRDLFLILWSQERCIKFCSISLPICLRCTAKCVWCTQYVLVWRLLGWYNVRCTPNRRSTIEKPFPSTELAWEEGTCELGELGSQCVQENEAGFNISRKDIRTFCALRS